MGKGDKRDKQFGQMIEAAMRWNKAVRIGVNWGSLDQELLAELMDTNNRRSTPGRLVRSCTRALIHIRPLNLRVVRRPWGWTATDHPVVQGQRVQDLISVYREVGAPLRLRFAPGPDQKRVMGTQGNGRFGGRFVRAAARGHWRHDSCR